MENATRIQSITVNDNEVIAFDMTDGKIKYFDKKSGKRNEDKVIATEKITPNYTVQSHHDLASTNERLLAGVPGFTFGLLSFQNELKVFDNATGDTLAQRDVSLMIGTLQSLAIDRQNNRVFVAFDDKIAVFGEEGYLGFFLVPTRNVHKLNFDQDTGCLMISMTEGEGKVEVYSPGSIVRLLQTSRELKSSLGVPSIDPGLLKISEGSQESLDEDSNKHIK